MSYRGCQDGVTIGHSLVTFSLPMGHCQWLRLVRRIHVLLQIVDCFVSQWWNLVEPHLRIRFWMGLSALQRSHETAEDNAGEDDAAGDKDCVLPPKSGDQPGI